MSHEAFMRHALRLAERGLGRVFPNPAVGCVLVKNGQIIGTGSTANGGRPHAETQALEQAGKKAKGATAYVTLEPCAHYGNTPPCAETLIKAEILSVVVACGDPDERVAGKGIASLREAGIDVIIGVCHQEALALNAGFFSRILRHRPLVALKVATSLDGKIAAANTKSQWITGEEARNYGHVLRTKHDAILTGIGTVLADNPSLTCRLAGLKQYSPIRVILDSALQTPPDARIVQTACDVPTWILTTKPPSAVLEKTKVRVVTLPEKDGHVCLESACVWLAEQGITRILTEGGSGLNGALWQSGLVDMLYWFYAPIMLGSSGLSAFRGDYCPSSPSEIPRLKQIETISFGTDHLEIFTCSPAS